MKKRQHKHLRRFQPNPEADLELASAKTIARLLTSSDRRVVRVEHLKGVLSKLFWLTTEVHGKYTTRYRSAGVLMRPKAKVQHEHVITRKSLIHEALQEGADIDAIFGKAVACVVTVEEHEALADVDAAAVGWDRYKAAGIVVYDFEPEEPAPTDLGASPRRG